MICDQARKRLDALADGELETEERVSVEAHLASCTVCAADFQELKTLSSLLRTAPYHRAPAGLRGGVRRTLHDGEGPAPTAVWRTRAVSGLIGAVAGFACALFLLRPTLPPPDEAIARHSEAMLSGNLLEVKSSDHHQVRPWFSRHVDFSPPLPDLTSAGFPLTGGRTALFEGRTAAVLVYERRHHVIDVFVRPMAGGDARPRHSSGRGFNVAAWRQGDFAFTAVSDLNGVELAHFSELMRAAP